MSEQINGMIEADVQTVEEDSTQDQGRRTKRFILFGVVAGLMGLVILMLWVTPLGKAVWRSKGEESKHEEKVAAAPPKVLDPKNLAFILLPDILVNLRTKTGKGKFLKISLTLELENAKDKDLIENLKPRIIDQFQVFLRELEIEDLTGSGALERLRHELVARVNNICAPTKIADVLFKEMLVQ